MPPLPSLVYKHIKPFHREDHGHLAKFSALKGVFQNFIWKPLQQNVLIHKGQVGSTIRLKWASTFQLSVLLWQVDPLGV